MWPLYNIHQATSMYATYHHEQLCCIACAACSGSRSFDSDLRRAM